MAQPENNHQVRGRPRQPKESGENANGALGYEAETETCQCAQWEKGDAATEARGAAVHVATHTKASQKKRRQQEQKSIRENAYRNSDETKIRPHVAIWERKPGILRNHTRQNRTGTGINAIKE